MSAELKSNFFLPEMTTAEFREVAVFILESSAKLLESHQEYASLDYDHLHQRAGHFVFEGPVADLTLSTGWSRFFDFKRLYLNPLLMGLYSGHPMSRVFALYPFGISSRDLRRSWRRPSPWVLPLAIVPEWLGKFPKRTISCDASQAIWTQRVFFKGMVRTIERLPAR